MGILFQVQAGKYLAAQLETLLFLQLPQLNQQQINVLFYDTDAFLEIVCWHLMQLDWYQDVVWFRLILYRISANSCLAAAKGIANVTLKGIW